MPEASTVSMFSGPRMPSFTRFQPLLCRGAEVLPITSKGSPYSLIVQLSLIWTLTPPAVQVQLPA